MLPPPPQPPRCCHHVAAVALRAAAALCAALTAADATAAAVSRNGHLLAMGGGREAMADDAHGVDDGKKHEAPVCQKKGQKREVTWNFGKSPPMIVMV